MMLGGYSSSSSSDGSEDDSDNEQQETRPVGHDQRGAFVETRDTPGPSQSTSSSSVLPQQGRGSPVTSQEDSLVEGDAVGVDMIEVDESSEVHPSSQRSTLHGGSQAESNDAMVMESMSVSMASPSSEPSTPEEVSRLREVHNARAYIEEAKANAAGRCSSEARKNVANLKRQAQAGRYVHAFLMANRKFHNPKWTDEMFAKFGITEEIQQSTTLPRERYDPTSVALSERDYWDWRPVPMQPQPQQQQQQQQPPPP